MTQTHPFERTGNGVGPFTWETVISLPTPGINSTAYNLGMELAHAQARSAGVSLGCCDHCGTGLKHHAVISDSEGKRFVVGLDCVRKTDDASLGNRAKIAQAKIRRETAKALREAKHEAWLDSVSDPETGETQRERKARHQAEYIERQKRADRDRETRAAKVVARWQFWLERVPDTGTGFVASIREGLTERGNEPTGRGVTICGEIFAKTFGRAGSKKFNEGYALFESKIQ